MCATNALAGPPDMPLDDFQPRLIAGETKQGYLTSKFKHGRTANRPLPQRMPSMQIVQKLRFVRSFQLDGLVSWLLTRWQSTAKSISFSDDLNDDELNILGDCGLKSRCPHAFGAWNERNLRNKVALEAEMKAREVEGKGKLIAQDFSKLQTVFLHEAITKAVESFPWVNPRYSTSTNLTLRRNTKKDDLLFEDDIHEITDECKGGLRRIIN
jgi:hypothetical protein